MQLSSCSAPPTGSLGRGRVRRTWTSLAVVLCFASASAAAQEGMVAGAVISAQSQRPLAGAQITVEGSTRQAVTDARGGFRITGLEGSEVRLRVALIGYQPAARTARIGDTGIRVALAEAAVALDALVVTGTAGGTERRALGNAVTTINAAEVVDQAPVNNVQQLLNGRAAGVVIQPGSGSVGTGARIRIRGASSFSLSNEPLIYVDGVRINNAPATGPTNQGFGSSSISRLNDFNPEDIASIEVLKGPAAATLYGTEASNGVIQIITKRGAAGSTRWDLNVKQGSNYLQNPEGRFRTNYQLMQRAGAPTGVRDTVSIDIVELENQRGTPIFRNGRLQEYDLNVSGGTERFRFFAAGGYEDSEGAERSNDLRRYNTRLNLNIAPSPRLTVDLGMGYVSGRTNLSAEAGFGGRVWSTVLANPVLLADTIRRGFHSGTPEQYDELYNLWQDISRFTGTVQVNSRTTSWLQQRLSFGADFTREQNVSFSPRIEASRIAGFAVFGSEALGSKDVTDRDLRYRTVDYSATASFNPTRAVSSRTSVGGQYYRTSTSFVNAYGAIFPAPGLSSIQATTQNRRNDEDAEQDVTVGVFAQQQFGLNERLFLTAGLRADDNSAFGQDYDRVYYPKLSASWVLSDEPFFPLGEAVNTLRLRAAYGQAGKQPRTFAALRTYAPEIGPGDQPAVTPQFIGNPALAPERGSEVELGLDAGFLQDRLGLEFTYYNKLTEDAILEREIAPSVGFPGFQFFNAGRVRNTGLELTGRARVLQRRQVAMELTAAVATNDNEVLDLGLEGINSVTAGAFLRHQEGYPIGAFFEQRVVSAELDATGRASNVMCDDDKGGSTPCAGADGRFGTTDDAPDVYLGRSLPRVEGAFSSTLTLFGRLRLYGLIDYKTGMRKVDGNTRVRCTFFGGRCRENFYPLEFQDQPERIAAIQSSNNLVDFLIDDASFAKLREISATYTLPDILARRAGASRAAVSLAGRNLHTWTRYGGLEPEAMFLSGARGGNFGAFEQTTLPQLTQWVLGLNLSF